jgi:hypothetical protein
MKKNDVTMPLGPACEFAESNGLVAEVHAIKNTKMYPHFNRAKQVRKALLLDLFEQQGLLDDFFAQRWPAGATAAGKQRRASYSLDRDTNQRLLNGEQVVNEQQRSCIMALLEADTLSHKDIAAKVGVSPGVVSVIDAQPGADSDNEDDVGDADHGQTARIEKDLQDALRRNIEQLESGLEIIDGGKERHTDAGYLDITARDRNGTIVVIELKAGLAKPAALTQVLAYVATISGKEKKPVRGLLVAAGFHDKVSFAVKAVPNVQLRQYRYKFTFEAVS